MKIKKKGNFADVAEWIRVSLIIGIVLVIVLIFLNDFETNVNANTEIPNKTKEGLTEYNNILFNGGDLIIPFLYIAFIAFSVISARLIPSSPKLLFIGTIALVLLPLVAMFFNNVWFGFASHSKSVPILNDLPITKFMLNNSVYFVTFYTLFVGIALYTKGETT